MEDLEDIECDIGIDTELNWEPVEGFQHWGDVLLWVKSLSVEFLHRREFRDEAFGEAVELQSLSWYAMKPWTKVS